MQAQGELEAAPRRDVVKRAVAMLDTRYGPSHPPVANTPRYLGGLEFDATYVVAPSENYEPAPAIERHTLAPDHPEIAFSLNNIAKVRGAQGDFAGALLNHEPARAILQKLGGEQPNAVRLTFNMAELCGGRHETRVGRRELVQGSRPSAARSP